MNAPYKTITSATNPIVKKIRSLKSKKFREETNSFIVEGLDYITTALKENWEPDIFVFVIDKENDPDIQATCMLAHNNKALCIAVTRELMQRITGRDNTQPVICVFKKKWHTLDHAQHSLLGLENIRDPGNLGTIIRTAIAVGIKDIVLINTACDAFSPETIRASVGAFSQARLIHVSTQDFIQWKKEWNGHLIGTHIQTSTDYKDASYNTQPTMIVMGGEQSGLSSDISDICDTLVKIPMPGGTESLNLAVSTGIMLYEALRQSS